MPLWVIKHYLPAPMKSLLRGNLSLLLSKTGEVCRSNAIQKVRDRNSFMLLSVHYGYISKFRNEADDEKAAQKSA